MSSVFLFAVLVVAILAVGLVDRPAGGGQGIDKGVALAAELHGWRSLSPERVLIRRWGW